MKLQGKPVPDRAANIINSMLSSDAIQAPADVDVPLPSNSLTGLVRHASIHSISSYPDYASWKACESDDDIDDEMMEHAYQMAMR